MTAAPEVLDLQSLDVIDDRPLPLPQGEWRLLTIAFDYVDVAEASRRARAHVYIPPVLLRGEAAVAPLLGVAGYEIASGVGALLLPWWAEGQPVIVNPLTPTEEEAWPGANAMARGMNLDVALLHLARSLPFVDDARVVITGQSAGGYTALMLAAETFPLAGVAPDVAPVDLGFNAQHLLLRHRLALDLPEGSDMTPRPEVAMVMEQAMSVLGQDTSSATWWDHSPVGRLQWITAPVSVVMSSADLLVPIAQVGVELAPAHDASAFPAGFAMDPKQLMGDDRPGLLELLPDRDLAVHHVPVPPSTPEIRLGTVIPPASWLTLDIPDAPVPWNIAVLDEGPTEPWIDHMRYATLFARNAFFERCLGANAVGLEQLSLSKLGALMDRYAGIEWATNGIRHLDTPEHEHRDVVRGLRTYVRAGTAHAERFLALYDELDSSRQVLGPADAAWAVVSADD